MKAPFEALDPNLIISAVEDIGIPCSGLIKTLNSMENRVYMIEGEDRKKWVAKFYRPDRWSKEAIQDEHTFIQELAEEKLPVIPPIPIHDNKTIGERSGFFWALFPYKEGRASQDLYEDELINLGAFIGQIHVIGKRRQAPYRLKLSTENYIIKNTEYLEQEEVLPSSISKEYLTVTHELASIIEPALSKLPAHRIHGDFHRGNFIAGASGRWLVDFDDMCMGPAIQDIWLICPAQDEAGKESRSLLVEGYQSVAEFDTNWLRFVEPLRAARLVNYAAWISRRWGDAAFKKYFPNFGTLEYWQSELNALKEQLAKITAQMQPRS